MSGKVIIDTSVWVEFFRGRNRELVEKVSVFLKTGRAAYTGIIGLELLNGAKGKDDLAVLRDALDSMVRVSEKESTFSNAGQLGYNLARKGFSAGTVDLLIAATCIENNLELMTLDRHFEAIARHSDLRLQG